MYFVTAVFIWLTGLYKCVLIEATQNLPLLAATLRTYQRAACDSEQLTLSCPRGTSISIELAQYGRAGDLRDHSLCPALPAQENLTMFRTSTGAEIEIKPPETCAINGLQYALLQAVVAACQKKRHCKFTGNSTIVTSGDPCYGIRKFIEIAYKCRPYEFRSKVACEDDSLVLMCNPYSRIAIYSASFGHVERDSVQCGHNTTEISEKACLVAYATETVMQICHGRRRCTVAADAGTFGRPCKTEVRMYLKVVYTCLPRKVLKDRYETAPENDEPQSDMEVGQDELYDEDQFYKESEAVPPKAQGAIPNAAAKPFEIDNELNQHSYPTSTFMTPMLTYNESTLEENQDELYLYVVISVTAGVLICLTLVIGRLTLLKQSICCPDQDSEIDGKISNISSSRYNRNHAADNKDLPQHYDDELSDIDIDLTTPTPVGSYVNKNEAMYMARAATSPSCTYNGLTESSQNATHTTNLSTDATVFVPVTPGSSLLMPRHGQVTGIKSLGGVLMSANRQASSSPPPPTSMYTNSLDGVCNSTISGTITMAPRLMAPAPLSALAPHSAGSTSYLTSGIMMPAHQHAHIGTLRRLMPANVSVMGLSAPVTTCVDSHINMAGIPSASQVYYDSTMPRNLTQPNSSTQFMYG